MNSTDNYWYRDYVLDTLHTGSRVICNPAPTDTDDDWLLLSNLDVIEKFEEELENQGFKLGGFSEGSSFVQDRLYCYTWENDTTKEIFISSWFTGIPDFEINSKSYPGSAWTLKEIRYNKELESKKLEEYPDWLEVDHSDRSNIFHSWRKDQLNLIVTGSTEYFENFKKATNLATRLNLLNKPDRIALFEGICFDVWPEL